MLPFRSPSFPFPSFPLFLSFSPSLSPGSCLLPFLNCVKLWEPMISAKLTQSVAHCAVFGVRINKGMGIVHDEHLREVCECSWMWEVLRKPCSCKDYHHVMVTRARTDLIKLHEEFYKIHCVECGIYMERMTKHLRVTRSKHRWKGSTYLVSHSLQ